MPADIAGCGDDLAVVDEARLGTQLDPLAERREQLERPPVRGRRPAVEQPGVGEHQRSGADTGHQRAGSGARADPLADSLVAQLAAGPDAPRVDEHIDRAQLIPGAVGEHAQPLGAADRIVGLCDREDLDAIIGPAQRPAREHLPRSGPVRAPRRRRSAQTSAMRIADQPSGDRRTDDDRRTLRESRLDL